jgi:hypothetical protein
MLDPLLLVPARGADELPKPTTPREQYEVLTKEFWAAMRLQPQVSLDDSEIIHGATSSVVRRAEATV